MYSYVHAARQHTVYMSTTYPVLILRRQSDDHFRELFDSILAVRPSVHGL